MEDKTARLKEAMKQVSGLKMASQKVKKQLEASRMEESKCQIKLKDAVKVIEEAKKKLKHVMDDPKQLVKSYQNQKRVPVSLKPQLDRCTHKQKSVLVENGMRTL